MSPNHARREADHEAQRSAPRVHRRRLNRHAAAAVLLAALLLAGCAEKAGGQHDHGAPAAAGADHHAPALEKLTHFTEKSELFVEFPPLVAGQAASLTAYVTQLADFKPLAQGRLTVLLSGGEAPEERFVVDRPASPGLFRLAVAPKAAGERELTLLVESSGTAGTAGPGTLTHELGPVTVFADAKAAKIQLGGGTGGIPFAKEQQWKIDFATAEAVRGQARASVAATGTIKARPDGEALLVAPAAGIVRPAGAFPRVGQAVKQGQVLALLAPRLGGETDQATLDAAVGKARIGLEQATRERERMDSLFKDEAIAEKRLFEARANEGIARAELDAALARAAQLTGGNVGNTARTPGEPSAGKPGDPAAGRAAIALRSPIAGTIAEVAVTPGAFLGEGAPLFHIAQTARLWLEARVPESAIGRLGTPIGAAFTVDGFDRTFEINARDGRRNGRLIAVGSVVDAATRTLPVIFEFDNPAAAGSVGALRLGMGARVQVFSASAQAVLLIPASAVQDESGSRVVYVQTGGDAFERRIIETGPRDGANVAVLAGLEPGQRVVSRGAYLIRLSTSKAGPAGHAH